MRKSVLVFFGATALSIGSAASASVSVGSLNNITSFDINLAGSNVTPVPTVLGQTVNIAFTGAQVASGASFTDSFAVTDSFAGLYYLSLSGTPPGMDFTGASIDGTNFTIGSLGSWASSSPVSLGTGPWTISFTGNNNSGTDGIPAGTLSVLPALPEPGTWAMMLLGFGAIGVAVRSRRKPALAQIA